MNYYARVFDSNDVKDGSLVFIDLTRHPCDPLAYLSTYEEVFNVIRALQLDFPYAHYVMYDDKIVPISEFEKPKVEYVVRLYNSQEGLPDGTFCVMGPTTDIEQAKQFIRNLQPWQPNVTYKIFKLEEVRND